MNAFHNREFASGVDLVLSGRWIGNEIQADFSAEADRCDYGVPGSPTWNEPRNITISGLTILGLDIDPSILPAPLRKALIDLADEVTQWSPA